MALTSSELKVLKILKKIKETLDKSSPEFKEKDVDEFLKAVEEHLVPGEENYDMSKHTSMLIPIEKLQSIPCKSFGTEMDITQAINFLKNNDVSILAFDGSTHNLGRHFSINLFVVNVGYWYQNYASGGQDSGNDSHVIVEPLTEKGRRIKSKEFEYLVAEEASRNLDGNKKVVLYDESFNMNFTLTWDVESRHKYTKLFEGHINKMLAKGMIPVGVFYTGARDIYRAYDSLKNKEKLIEEEIPDKVIMNKYLMDGHRSNLFNVKSDALQSVNVELRSFFIKYGEKNVLRVEFPAQVEEHTDLIHCTVLSQLILGGGYPISLQRAHEWAVLTSQDRELIEREAARLLGIPYVEMAYSKKLYSKRRPLV